MSDNLNRYNLRIIQEDGKERVFDIIRKKYVVLTPEEWVRQHIIHYLISDHKFPKALISVEKQLLLNGLSKRTDIVLYNRNASPILIVECKSPDVPLSQAVVDQAARYNITLRVPWLWVTNGEKHAICNISFETETWKWVENLPAADDLLGGE